MVEQRLNFTGRREILASFAYWRVEWFVAYCMGDVPRKQHAAQMRDRMARALREDAR